MSKSNGSKMAAARSDLARIDAEISALREALARCETDLAAVLLQRDTTAPGVVVGANESAKIALRQLNDKIHNLRLDLESYRSALTRVEAQRAGALAALDELQRAEKRNELCEQLKAREAAVVDLQGSIAELTGMFYRVSEIQTLIAGLRYELGERDNDWRQVARAIEEAIGLAVMSNPSLKFRLDSIEFGQGRARLHQIMAEEAVPA